MLVCQEGQGYLWYLHLPPKHMQVSQSVTKPYSEAQQIWLHTACKNQGAKMFHVRVTYKHICLSKTFKVSGWECSKTVMLKLNDPFAKTQTKWYKLQMTSSHRGIVQWNKVKQSAEKSLQFFYVKEMYVLTWREVRTKLSGS